MVRDDATAVVADPSEAGAVYGRGYFGVVQSGGLLLDRFESVYLLEMDRLPLVDSDGHPSPVARTVPPKRHLRRGGVRGAIHR